MRDQPRRRRSNAKSFSDDDRSVSEILGYIIVFGLVVTSVAFVLTFGISSLQDYRDVERVSNAERAFDVVADNMAAIYERNAPSRATEIDLGTSSIFYANQTEITIEVVRPSGTTTYSRELRPVEHRLSSGESVVYEAGAVIRDGRGDSGFMLRESPMLFTEDRVHVPIVQTTADSQRSVGSTTVLLRGTEGEREVLDSDYGSVTAVNIDIDSERSEQWANHLNQEDALSCSVNSGVAECSWDPASGPGVTYITLQEIQLELIL